MRYGIGVTNDYTNNYSRNLYRHDGSVVFSLCYRIPDRKKKMNDKLEYFNFLDDLRLNGTINMVGAPRELQHEFGLNKVQARSIFQLWCLNLEGE